METILPKPRKSQVTVFILLGLVLVLVAGFAFFAAERAGPGTVAAEGAGSLKLFVESCLKIATLDAMHEHGLDPGISTPLIEGYVTSYMPSCLNNFDTYREEGLEVTEGEMTVDATITGEALTVDLDYPVTLRDEDSVFQFESASYQFPRKVMTTLKPGAETVVTSQDKRILLIIPPGTEATLDGQPLERVGIEVLDREFGGNSNSVLAGMLAFAGIPHGAEFSQPVTLIHFYDDRDVPSTIPEDSVRLGFWNEKLGTWVGLPTTVDSEQNILTATTTHFSPYGAVLRCQEEKNEVVFHAPLLVKEDCEPCEGWSATNPPSGVPGELWIKSNAITKQHSVGTVPVCSDTEVTRVVNVCSNCNDCSGEDDQGHCPQGGCGCTEKYFYYDIAEFKGSAEVTIEFAEDGDSCIWNREGSAEPPIVEIEGGTSAGGAEDAAIVITAICGSGEDDSCLIESTIFEENTLRFTLEVTNGGAPDACIEGGASVSFNGFGIQSRDSYYTCEKEGDEKVMPFIGGETEETTLSVCTCEEDDNETEVCQWTIKEQEEPANGTEAPTIPIPAAGTVISGDGTDAESRRKKDKCPEGDKTPKEYETCPDDFEETYKDKNFTYNAVQDTRNRDFCDWFGDFPEMQYVDWSLKPDTKLYVMGSADRNGRCWLMVEAQEWIEARKEHPDFYLEFENASDWIPVNGAVEDCPPAELGYVEANISCDFPGEYRCEEAGEGEMLSQICCGSGETGLLYSKTCEGCDEESGKCTEDI